ncbi:MAG: DUF3363 domain-containing protein [Solimonas sp.]
MRASRTSRAACRLARKLLATLRGRKLAQTAQEIAAETGLKHRPTADGQRVADIYRRIAHSLAQRLGNGHPMPI